MSLYYRVQPAGLGLHHRSETSSGEIADGLHVFINASEAESLSEGGGYGDEVVILDSDHDWSNGDVEGVCINGAKARIIARVPHSQFCAEDWDLATLRGRHAALCEQINEEVTPFREASLPVACAERDRLWGRIEALSGEETDD